MDRSLNSIRKESTVTVDAYLVLCLVYLDLNPLFVNTSLSSYARFQSCCWMLFTQKPITLLASTPGYSLQISNQRIDFCNAPVTAVSHVDDTLHSAGCFRCPYVGGILLSLGEGVLYIGDNLCQQSLLFFRYFVTVSYGFCIVDCPYSLETLIVLSFSRCLSNSVSNSMAFFVSRTRT